MRKTAIALLVALVPAIPALSQTAVEFVPSAGYSFPGRNDFYNVYGRVAGGLNLGGAINFNVNRDFGMELLYNHVSTTSGIYNYGYDGGNQLTGGNLKLDYIMAGPVFSGNIPNTTVRPFLGILLGAAILTPDPAYQSNSYFTIGFQLGTNIYLSPRVGIQLKAQLLSPVAAAGGAFYYNNYNGGGINPNQSISQFTLGGGLIIGLGRVLPKTNYVYHRPRPRYYRYY
jgi:hypothetical protein